MADRPATGAFRDRENHHVLDLFVVGQDCAGHVTFQARDVLKLLHRVAASLVVHQRCPHLLAASRE